MTATSILQGAASSQNITAGQKVVDMADKIYLLEPNAAPLYVLVSKLNKRVAINTNFSWLEDDLNPSWASLAASADSAATAGTTTTKISTQTSEGYYFNPYDIIKFPSSGELCLVTGISASQILVVRGYGTTICSGTAEKYAISTYFFRIGSAFTEASLAGTLATVGTVTSSVTNYTQIFRKSVELSRTLANVELYGGADRPYQRKKKGIELMREMERTFYFGEPKEWTSGAVATTALPQRLTGGINYFISTNTTDAGGTLTESEFEGFLRTVFRYGSNSRYLFAAPLIISIVSLWAQGKLQMFPKDKTYGIAITQYLSPHGTVNLVKDVTLEHAGVISNTSYFGGYAYAIELEDVVYRYLQNRDIQMETDIQNPGDDLYKDQYICEVGMEFHNEKKHGRLWDVTG